MKKLKKKNATGIKGKVIKLLEAGAGPTEAARKAGCSVTTARYHAKKLAGNTVDRERQVAVDIINNMPKAQGMKKLDEKIKELEAKLNNYRVCKNILEELEDS